MTTPGIGTEPATQWSGHDRGRLRRDQIVGFLRSVIASRERLSYEDVADIEAALRRRRIPLGEALRNHQAAIESTLRESIDALPNDSPDVAEARGWARHRAAVLALLAKESVR